MANRKIDRKLKTRVSILLLVCLAMPAASKDTGLDQTTSVQPVASLTIKYCGNILLPEYMKNNEIHVTETQTDTARDIELLERVKMQLEVARSHFRNINENVARLYSPVKNVMKTDYNYEWLPSRSLSWYKEYINKHDKDTQILLLTKLRDSLHNFLITLDQMRKFNKTNNNMFVSTERKSLLDDLSKHLNAVLCEVETALLTLNSWQSKEPPADTERTVTVGGPGWDPNPDCTTMMIQDWGVLTTYYWFLKNWQYITTRMVKDQKRLLLPDPRPSDSFAADTSASLRSPSSDRLLSSLLHYRHRHSQHRHRHHHRHHHLHRQQQQHHGRQSRCFTRGTRRRHRRRRKTPDSAVT